MTSHHYANARAFARAQWAWDNMSPSDDDGGLQQCPTCAGACEIDGEPCLCCQNRRGQSCGYFFRDEPITAREYERMCDQARAPS